MQEDSKAEGIGEDQSAPASEESILDELREAMSGTPADDADDDPADEAEQVAEDDEQEDEAEDADDAPEPEAAGKKADEDDDDPVMALDPAYVARALKGGMSMKDIRGYAKRDPEYLVRLVQSLDETPAKAETKADKPSWTKAVIDEAMKGIGDEFDEEQKDAIRKSHEAVLKGIEQMQGKAQTEQQRAAQIAQLRSIVDTYDASIEKIDPKGELYGKGPSIDNKHLGQRALQRRDNLYQLARWFQEKGAAKSAPEALEMAHAGLNHKRIEQSATNKERTRIRESATRRARSATTAGSQKLPNDKRNNSDEAVLSELRGIMG